MIIGIDGNEANVEKKVGIGEYAFELLTQFKKYTVSGIQYQVYLKNKPRQDMPEENENWRYKVFGPKKYWTQFALPARLFFEKRKPDVFFSPSHYAPRFSPVPTAIAIMDVSYIHFPQLFRQKDLYQLRNWTAYSAHKAQRIFTISQASKNDILKEYKVPEEKVVVTYPGVKQVLSIQYKVSSMAKVREYYGVKGNYILFVGTLQPRKNIVRLIEAFSKLKEKSDIQLIIVGKKGWQYEEILAAPEKFGVSKTVKFLEFVSDEDLKVLYESAEFFILPSLYEGFGLPVLEAMSYGCPVITSNVSSLPEAAGDAALYVDPENVADIAEKMQKLLSDKPLRKALQEKGYQQIKKFSWEKTAKETLKVLEGMVR